MPLKPKTQAPGPPHPLHITLTDTERHLIHGWLRSTTVATGQARRARAVLLLADGRPLSQVAAMVGVARNSVYKYAARFLAQGVDGLRDRQLCFEGRGRRCHPCPHDRLAHCMWCLAAVLDAESATLAALYQLVARAEETASMTRCAYCEAAPAIVRCGD